MIRYLLIIFKVGFYLFFNRIRHFQVIRSEKLGNLAFGVSLLVIRYRWLSFDYREMLLWTWRQMEPVWCMGTFVCQSYNAYIYILLFYMIIKPLTSRIRLGFTGVSRWFVSQTTPIWSLWRVDLHDIILSFKVLPLFRNS